MTKKTVTLGISIILMAGLFGTWYLLKTGNEKAREQEEAAGAGDVIVSMAEEDTAAVAFEIAGETCSFTREDGAWKLDGDEHFTGNEEMFSTLLGYFAPLRANRTLEDIEDLSEYGLDDPVNTFTLTGTDGSETVLLIGNNNEGTGDDYVMRAEDEDTVYTISTSLRDTIRTELTDYASSESLPSFSSDAVVRVEVRGDTTAYILIKDEGEWTMEGVSESLDQESTGDVISELGYIYYSDYISYYCEDPSQYGLDSGKQITIMYEDGSDEKAEYVTESAEEVQTGDISEEDSDRDVGTLSFLIGDQDETGNYYVQQEGSHEVHTLSETMINTFLELDVQNLKEAETEGVSEAET